METTEPSGNGHLLERNEFIAYIEEQLRAIAEVEVLHREGLDLTLRVRGGNIRVNLENFYSAYLNNPAQLDAVTRTFVKTLQGFGPDRSIKSFEALRERVYPMLKPIALLAEVHERKLPMLVYRPFLADLIITYVIDEPDSVAFINEEHLEQWGIAEHVLHERALTNLRQRTLNATDYTTAGTGAQQLFIFNSQDGYDATRILLPDVLERWHKELPGNIVIGIPNRDFLIAFSDADRTVLINIAQQIQRDIAERPYGLTDRLFTLMNGEIREYELE